MGLKYVEVCRSRVMVTAAGRLGAAAAEAEAEAAAAAEAEAAAGAGAVVAGAAEALSECKIQGGVMVDSLMYFLISSAGEENATLALDLHKSRNPSGSIRFFCSSRIQALMQIPWKC